MADDPPDSEQSAYSAHQDASHESAFAKAEPAGIDEGSDGFATAVRVTRMPMIITNPREPDNPIVFANDAFCQLTGYPREEVLGRNCRFLQGPESDPATVGRIRTAIAARQSIETDIRNHTKDGRLFWNRLLIAPVHDAVGTLIYFFASQFDVTSDRENLAARVRDLAEANERLRAEAAQREQLEEALRQAQKMEAVGQLTGGLAHDFNNLLTGIMGGLELLQIRLAQGRIADCERYIEAAQSAAKRAASLTHRLLAFSRRQTLAPRSTDIHRLATGMEDLIRHTVGPAVGVEVITAGGLWNTLIDPNQLENALLNLCINARDAMPGGGRLTIEIENKCLDLPAAQDLDVPPGHYVLLCVSDTGSGMMPEVIRRAFDPFYTTKPIGSGTGLGLSMIYGFVRQSGGQARIQSEPGQGTMVCLYLPRELSEADTPEEATTSMEAHPASGNRSILVVDDEPTVRMLVTEILGNLGYSTVEAGDGAAGLRVLQSDARISLLITDVGLPGGMNGRQVADAARALRPDLKVLFITGFAETVVLNNGNLDAGMHVVTKPFTVDELVRRVNTLITNP